MGGGGGGEGEWQVHLALRPCFTGEVRLMLSVG